MHPRLAVSLLALLLVAPVLAGCLEQQAAPPPAEKSRTFEDGARSAPALIAAWSFDQVAAGFTEANLANAPEGVSGKGFALADGEPLVASVALPQDAEDAAAIAFWYKPEAPGSGTLLSVAPAGCPPATLAQDADGTLRLTREQSLCGPPIEAATPTPLPLNEWTHVEFDWKSKEVLRVHVDGEAVAAVEQPPTGTPTALPMPQVKVTLGGDGVEGTVDDVRLYTGPLDETLLRELATLPSTSETPPDVPGALGVWHLDREDAFGEECCGMHEEKRGDRYGKRHPNTTFVPGRFGEAVATADKHEWVVIPYDLPATPEEGTLSLWVRPATAAEDRNVTILGLRTDCGSMTLFVNGAHPSVGFARWWFCETASGGASAMTFPRDVPPERWTHLAVTWSHGGHALYIDGEEAARDETPATPVPPAAAAHGGGCTPEDCDRVPDPYANLLRTYFPGAIDEIRLYPRALTAEEIGVLAGAG